MTNEKKKRKQADPEAIRRRVEELIRNFETELRTGGLRPKVLALVPIFHGLRDLGKALIPSEYASAARDRILYYFREYPRIIINGDELLVVSGIQEYARRVRELRVQFGWGIVSGVTIKEMLDDKEEEVPHELKVMRPSDYVLLHEAQDRDAAHRWNVANAIRKERGSVRDKILKFLRANVGKGVTNEELRYVAGDKTEWARRVRELRSPPHTRNRPGALIWISEYICSKPIGRALSMIGTFWMIYGEQSCAVTHISAKNVNGPMMSGIHLIPGT